MLADAFAVYGTDRAVIVMLNFIIQYDRRYCLRIS
jgi:hypothetical protein